MLPEDNQPDNPKAHTLPTKKEKVIAPIHDANEIVSDETAVNLIRNKLDTIFDGEPDAKKELAEDKAHHGRRSKHQQFMHELSSSGKSLAEIQTQWHAYYTALPDDEKHKVWQEFYSNYNKVSTPKPSASKQVELPVTPLMHRTPARQAKPTDKRTSDEIKERVRETVKSRAKTKNHHFTSIKFGLITGFAVILVMSFGFFNERFIAPFITPSHTISATPLIIDQNGKVGPEPKLIIPKINVEAPVVYDEASIAEEPVQAALERGTLHYATTPDPGEFGNSVIFGHSSNNIFNDGAYKYVFVQLNKLEIGDTFYAHKDGVRYVYKVYEKKIVKPSEVSVLSNTEKDATMTIITCDPPGTAINRLVVIGEQISPDISTNEKSNIASDVTSQPQVLPSNAPSLWNRITSWFSS